MMVSRESRSSSSAALAGAPVLRATAVATARVAPIRASKQNEANLWTNGWIFLTV
jgi:hypothetical protein